MLLLHTCCSSHFTGCSLEELWDWSAGGFTFWPNVSLLNDAAQYASCDAGYVGSAVLEDTVLNTTTVAYYTGITAGSSACFVCDEGSGYELMVISIVLFILFCCRKFVGFFYI